MHLINIITTSPIYLKYFFFTYDHGGKNLYSFIFDQYTNFQIFQWMYVHCTWINTFHSMWVWIVVPGFICNCWYCHVHLKSPPSFKPEELWSVEKVVMNQQQCFKQYRIWGPQSCNCQWILPLLQQKKCHNFAFHYANTKSFC